MEEVGGEGEVVEEELLVAEEVLLVAEEELLVAVELEVQDREEEEEPTLMVGVEEGRVRVVWSTVGVERR